MEHSGLVLLQRQTQSSLASQHGKRLCVLILLLLQLKEVGNRVHMHDVRIMSAGEYHYLATEIIYTIYADLQKWQCSTSRSEAISMNVCHVHVQKIKAPTHHQSPQQTLRSGAPHFALSVMACPRQLQSMQEI